MPSNEDPIFDFSPLKEFLKKRGYTIGTRLAYEPFIPEDVKAADIKNGTMSFSSEGIFVKGDDGVDRQVFLYKKDYHLEKYGKPRFHICKCDTIDEFISSGGFRQHYVRANSEPVPVFDLDSGSNVMIDALPLCNNCRNIIKNYGSITSTVFVELLRRANDNQQDEYEGVELDLFGYTKDWDTISKDFREKHKYTCEICGLKIEDIYDRQYMHVHHVNGDKLNNKENNLKCLCLYCHAHVNEQHMKRLTTLANKFIYEDFIRKYRSNHDSIDTGQPIKLSIENHFHGTIDNLTINNK
jgi:hypothetical protein